MPSVFVPVSDRCLLSPLAIPTLPSNRASPSYWIPIHLQQWFFFLPDKNQEVSLYCCCCFRNPRPFEFRRPQTDRKLRLMIVSAARAVREPRSPAANQQLAVATSRTPTPSLSLCIYLFCYFLCRRFLSRANPPTQTFPSSPASKSRKRDV